MGIADDECDARKRGEIFRRALRVTYSDNNFGAGVGGMNFTDGVARLSVGSGSDGARVDYNKFGGIWIGGQGASLIAELALDGSAVGLGGATAELLDVEGRHD